MKLLFDQNLSFQLYELLADLFPESSPVLAAGLAEADERVVWDRQGQRLHAGVAGF